MSENNKYKIYDSEVEDRNFSGELKEGSSFHTSESLFEDLVNHKKKKKKKRKKRLYKGKKKNKNKFKDSVKTVENPNIVKNVKTSKISYDFNRDEKIKRKAFEEFEKTRKQQIKNTITKLKREGRENPNVSSRNFFANPSYAKYYSSNNDKNLINNTFNKTEDKSFIDENRKDLNRQEINQRVDLDRLIKENKRKNEELIKEQKSVLEKNTQRQKNLAIKNLEESNGKIDSKKQVERQVVRNQEILNRAKNSQENISRILRDSVVAHEYLNSRKNSSSVENKNNNQDSSSFNREANNFDKQSNNFNKQANNFDNKRNSSASQKNEYKAKTEKANNEGSIFNNGQASSNRYYSNNQQSSNGRRSSNIKVSSSERYSANNIRSNKEKSAENNISTNKRSDIYGNSKGIIEGQDYHSMESTFEKVRSRVEKNQINLDDKLPKSRISTQGQAKKNLRNRLFIKPTELGVGVASSQRVRTSIGSSNSNVIERNRFINNAKRELEKQKLENQYKVTNTSAKLVNQTRQAFEKNRQAQNQSYSNNLGKINPVSGNEIYKNNLYAERKLTEEINRSNIERKHREDINRSNSYTDRSFVENANKNSEYSQAEGQSTEYKNKNREYIDKKASECINKNKEYADRKLVEENQKNEHQVEQNSIDNRRKKSSYVERNNTKYDNQNAKNDISISTSETNKASTLKSKESSKIKEGRDFHTMASTYNKVKNNKNLIKGSDIFATAVTTKVASDVILGSQATKVAREIKTGQKGANLSSKLVKNIKNTQDKINKSQDRVIKRHARNKLKEKNLAQEKLNRINKETSSKIKENLKRSASSKTSEEKLREGTDFHTMNSTFNKTSSRINKSSDVFSSSKKSSPEGTKFSSRLSKAKYSNKYSKFGIEDNSNKIEDKFKFVESKNKINKIDVNKISTSSKKAHFNYTFSYKKTDEKLRRKPEKNEIHSKIVSRKVKREAYLKNKEDLNKIYNRKIKENNLKDNRYKNVNPIDEISRQDLIHHKRELKRKSEKTFKNINRATAFEVKRKFDKERSKKAKKIFEKSSFANLDEWKANPKDIKSSKIESKKSKSRKINSRRVNSKNIKKAKEDLASSKKNKFTSDALEKTLKKSAKQSDKNSFYREKGYLYKNNVRGKGKLGSKEIRKKRLMKKMQLNALNRTKNMKIIAMEAARRGNVTPAQARYALLQSGSIKTLIKKLDETSIIASKLKKEKKEILIHRNKRDSYHRYAKNIGKVDVKSEKDIKRFYGQIKAEQRKHFNTAFEADRKNIKINNLRKKDFRRRLNRQIAYSKALNRKSHINRIKRLSEEDKKKVIYRINKHKSFENINKNIKRKARIEKNSFIKAKENVKKQGKTKYKKRIRKNRSRTKYNSHNQFFKNFKERHIDSKVKKLNSFLSSNNNIYVAGSFLKKTYKKEKVKFKRRASHRLKRMAKYKKDYGKRFKINLKYGIGMFAYDYSMGMILGRTTEDESYFKALSQLYGRFFISRLLLRDKSNKKVDNETVRQRIARLIKVDFEKFKFEKDDFFYKFFEKNKSKNKTNFKKNIGKARKYLSKNKNSVFQRFKYRSRRFGYLALRTEQSILRVNDDESSEALNNVFDTMYTGGKLGVRTAKSTGKIAKKTVKNTKKTYRFVRKNLSRAKKIAQQTVRVTKQVIKSVAEFFKYVLVFFKTPLGIATLVGFVLIAYIMVLFFFLNSLKLNETYDYGTITYNRVTKLDYDANMGESQRYRDANIDALNKLQAIRDGAWSSDEDLTVIVPRRKKLPIPEPYNPTSDGLFVRTDAIRLVQFLETVYQDDTLEQITDYALEQDDIDAGKEYESNFGLEKIPPTESEYNRQQKNLENISAKSAQAQEDNSTLIRKKDDGTYTNTKALSQDAIDAGIKEDPIDMMLDIFQRLHPPNSYTIDDANKDSLITKEISKDGQIKQVKIYYADRKDYPFDYFFGYDFAESKTGGDLNEDNVEIAVNNNTAKKLELPEGGEAGLGVPPAGEEHTGREMLFRLQGSDTRFRTMDAHQNTITGRLTNPFSSKELGDDPLNPGKKVDLTDPVYSLSWLIRHQDGYRYIDYDKEDEKNRDNPNKTENNKQEGTGTSTEGSTETTTPTAGSNINEAPRVSTVISNPSNPYDFPTTYVRRRFGFETDKVYKPASDNVSDVSGFETKNLNLNYNESQNYLKKNNLKDFGEYYDKKTGLVLNSVVDVVTMPAQKVYSPMEGKLVVAGNGFLGITSPTLEDERVGGGYILIANPDRYGAEGASSTSLPDLTNEKFYSASGKLKGFKHGTIMLIGGFDSESIEKLRIRAYDGENNWIDHYDELGTLKKVLKDEDPEEKARNEGSHKSDIINSEPGDISHPILGDMYQGLGPRGLGWGRPTDIAGNLIEKRGKWTVTAYSDDPSENGLGPGSVSTTATDKTKLPEIYKGVKDKDNLLRIGDVAVPRKNGKPIIPYGTYLWIDGYGFARATDTGGAMKGDWSTPNPENRVLDILMHNRDCNKWGRRVVEVIQFKGNPFENQNFDISGAGFTNDTSREDLDEEIQETDTLDKKVQKLSKKIQKLNKKLTKLREDLNKNPNDADLKTKIEELEKEIREKQAELDKFFKEHEEEAKKALEEMDVKEEDLQSVLYLQLYYVYPHIDLLASIGNMNVPVFKQTLGKLAGFLSDKLNTAYTYINPAMYMETGVLDYPDNKVQSYMLETGYGSYQSDLNIDDYFLDASNNVNQEDYMTQCSNDDGWTLPVSNNIFDGLKVVSSYGKRNKDYISEAASQEVQAFLNQARSYLGKYTYSQLDCSGYARAVLRDMGIDFPRISASKFLNKDQPWWKYVKAYRDVRETGGDPLEGIKPGDIIVMIKGVNGYATNLSITGHIAINVGMDKENGVNRGNNVMYHSTIGRSGDGPTQGVISDTYKNAAGWIRFFDAGPKENNEDIDPNNWEYSPTLEFTSSTVNRPIVGSMSKASVISTGTTQEGQAYVVTKQADSSGNDKYLVYEGLDPATLRVEKGDVLKPGTEIGISAGSVVKIYSPKDPTTQLVTDSQELDKFNNVLEVIHPDIAKKLHDKFTEGAKKAEEKEAKNKVKYNTSGEVFSKEAVCEIPESYVGTVTSDIIMMEGYPWMSQMSSIPNEYQNVLIHGKSKTYLQNGCGGWANAMGLTKALGRPVHVTETEPGFQTDKLVMNSSLMAKYINNTYGSELSARAVSSSTFRSSQNEITEALKSGGYAVIHSSGGDKIWTRRPSGEHRTTGHYVVLIGYDPENHPDKPYRVHDSANNNPSNTGWFTWEQVAQGSIGDSNMICRKK